ncbi:hypothetical protein GGR57DRAFT_389636 [Xylariaceae sp. FL1272]|nr:hypothetical protein GGR57DRAFT_389636 [Xylariaceae sp. FL1272]
MLIPLRIPIQQHGDNGDGLKARWRAVWRRETAGTHNGPPNTLIIIVVVVALVFFISAVACIFTKRRSKTRSKGRTAAGNLEPLTNATTSTTTNSNRRLGTSTTTENNRNSTATVDRNTSVRSIMTLPKYNYNVNEGEQVLGREGDRDGLDVIVDHPTDEQHEALRDEEMETMYQIRLTRRQQNAEREERRRLTSEARARGDSVALEELRARRRAETETNDAALNDLRETQTEVRSRRQRAVSSVSYGDLGVARHDGSRLRANSTESERVGLLSDAASIAQSTRSPSAQSNRRVSDAGSLAASSYHRSPSAQSHNRMRSESSVMSLDENGEVEPVSGATTPRLGSFHTRAGSSPEIVTEADLGDMPPPDYEDVSLDDARSGATTPMMIHGPPPDYPHSGHRTSESDSGDLGSPGDSESQHSSRRSSRGVGGVPQLPSLRIRDLPQIVIEPSNSARSGHPER